MTIQMNINEQYLDKFEAFVKSLPKDAIFIDNVDDNTVSFETAKIKVERSIENISNNKSMDLDVAFEKVANL